MKNFHPSGCLFSLSLSLPLFQGYLIDGNVSFDVWEEEEAERGWGGVGNFELKNVRLI